MYQRSLATSSSAALDPDIYTVGWICALDIEASIACEFLDKKDDLDKSLARADVNRYTLGTIGAHKVVIATIPPAGDSSATSISSRVKDMLYTFPNIRVALSVGIGSGVPAYCDIRLGDVVVGIPKDGRGGVVQYELDDSFGNTAVRLAETVYAPSRAMLNTIVSQRDEYPDVEEQIRDVIGSILDANPILREKYRRPKPETDVLSHANTVRQGNMYEGSYSKASGRAIHRPRRPDRLYDCVVYYGTVASGTSHIFDTFTRDKLVANNDVLCFENEAAGLTDRFRYLAIRGISEYSDSHGTEEWQRFAAMAAAAFAKSLLVRTPLQLIEKEMKIKDALSLENLTLSPDDLLSRLPYMEPSRMDENSPGILLYRAVVSGDIQLAKALLRSGANVNTRPDVEGSWKSDTSLHQAVKKGDAAMVKLLLEAPDLDIMARDELSYTAFTRAAQKGNNTIVELLLGRVLEPSASTKSVYIYGGTRKPAILHQYAYRDEIVKAIVGTINHHQDSTLDLLLETDIKNKLDGHGGEEIMYVAVMNRRASVMERLLRLTNIPINGIISKATHTEDPQDLEKFPLFGASRGSTAIELAAEYDIPEVVRLLFERDDIKLSPELKELKRECKNHDLDIHIALPFIVDALKRNGPWIVSQSNAIPASDKENYLNFLLTMSQDRGVRDDLAHDVGTRAEVQRRVSIYCGLGGVAPPVERHSSITNHIYITGTEAQIRYRPFATDDHELFRIIAKVVGNLEDAIKMLQAAKECTTEVTILTSCPGRWGPKEAQTIQMVSVQVKQIDSFYAKLIALSNNRQELTPGKIREIRSVVNNIFQKILPDFRLPLEKDEVLQACLLLSQVLSLGLLLFSQAHAGDIYLPYLTMPLKKVTLSSGSPSLQDIVAEQVSLNCMGDMISDSVFCLRLLDHDLPPGPFMLKATCEQIADCWGPGTLLKAKESGYALGMLIRGALIEPTEQFTDVFPLCHWGRELKTGDTLSKKFNYQMPIFVGAHIAMQSNSTMSSLTLPSRQAAQPPSKVTHFPLRVCPRNPSNSFNESQGQMLDLGTRAPRWKFTERQAMLQSGLHSSLQMGFTQTKQPGVPLKAVILDRWRRDGDLSLLERPVAVHVSICTGVAERISLRELFNNCFGEYISTLEIPECDAAFKSSAMKAMGTEQEFADWSSGLEPQQKRGLETIVDKLFACLKETGSFQDDDKFSILWPQPKRKAPQNIDVGSCVRLDITEKPQEWIAAIKDTDLCATFAAMTEACLEKHSFLCRKDVKAAWACAHMVSTSVYGNQVGRISQPTEKLLLPIEHNRTYWIGEKLFVADTGDGNTTVLLRAKRVSKNLAEMLSTVWYKASSLRESRYQETESQRVYLTSQRG